MNQTERELVILNSAWAMIDDMVNWEMFVKNHLFGPTTLLFQSRTHAELFIILLTDFLSPIQQSKSNKIIPQLGRPPNNASGANQTFIYHLRQVCLQPQLGKDVTELSDKIEEFASWLETSMMSRGVNLGEINIVADIELERIKYLKMCGNIAKHSLPRLIRVVSDLRDLLIEAGYNVSLQEAYLTTEPFFEWFFDDVFMFHSNQIAEFLNDIRWCIFEYLQPEYERSYHPRERFIGDYGYRIPDLVANPLAQAMYWNVLNRVRAKPWMERFVADDAFKRPHLSERFPDD